MRPRDLAALLALSLTTAAAAAQVPASAPAAAPAPNPDIYLASLGRRGDSLVVGTPENITRRAGYDNQPSFLPDASGLLYTVIGADAQADIWRYDIRSRRNTRVTATPESEYSPTVMPGGTRFSVVRVERDSTQRLWSFAMDGSDPQLLLGALQPVGYHAWLGPNRLLAYVLGTPSTLHVVDRDGANDEVRARDIGRALQRIPGQSWYSFTRRDSARVLWIVSQPFEGGPLSTLVRAPNDNEYHVWTPDGALLSATQGTIVRWDGRTGEDGEWLPIATLPGVKNISRLAVSPDGRWLAFVAEPATSQ
jgi:dipeptidyl aminopeptidase/acylaminoacyl peptidase